MNKNSSTISISIPVDTTTDYSINLIKLVNSLKVTKPNPQIILESELSCLNNMIEQKKIQLSIMQKTIISPLTTLANKTIEREIKVLSDIREQKKQQLEIISIKHESLKH